MASLSLAFGGAAAAVTNRRRRVLAVAAATKNVGSSGKEDKGLLDFILGGLQKEDQLLETDPILNKIDGNVSSITGGTTSLSNKKKPDGIGGGVFAGLFLKK